jgi:oxygen-independent coproporphyrinogen-3 oxidase
MDKQLSIYVHIPFCARKCLYCDFLSFNASVDRIESYFFALGKELELWAEEFRTKESEDNKFEVVSIFFGGGTPSFVESRHIVSTLKLIRELFRVKEDAEITIEANPASAMYEKLRDYRRAGINRLSIGAQSLNDEELKRLGRLHDSRMFFETYENARKAGFDNINIDIMSALPGQSLESYVSTLRKVTELRPEHISAYSLIVEEGTPFFDMNLELPDEEADRRMYHETLQILRENGYHRYEISNYALGKKYECRHNKVYWQRGNYLGVGIGAASMVENVRWNNLRDMGKYVDALSDIRLRSGNESGSGRSEESGNDSVEPKFLSICENIEELTVNGQMEEFMFLGLRLTKGVDTGQFQKLFGKKINEVYGSVIEKYIGLGLLEKVHFHESGYPGNGKEANEAEFLRLTEKGLDVSNTVMAEFLLED